MVVAPLDVDAELRRWQYGILAGMLEKGESVQESVVADLKNRAEKTSVSNRSLVKLKGLSLNLVLIRDGK